MKFTFFQTCSSYKRKINGTKEEKPQMLTIDHFMCRPLDRALREIWEFVLFSGNVEKPVARPELMESTWTQLLITEQNLTELSLVKLSARFGSSAQARCSRTLHHFPIPRLFHVYFALQPRSWGKTDAPSAAALPLLPSSSSSAGFLLFPSSCPLGFFYGKASNTWPLPCIRLHVHIHTQQNKTRAVCDKVWEWVCGRTFFCDLSVRWVQLPKSSSLPVFSSNNSILIYLLQNTFEL